MNSFRLIDEKHSRVKENMSICVAEVLLGNLARTRQTVAGLACWFVFTNAS